MQLNFNQRIFLCTLLVLSLFTAGIIMIKRSNEKTYKTEALETILDNYADLIHRYIEQQGGTNKSLDSLNHFTSLLRKNDLRITIIGLDGNVLYDNDVSQTQTMTNHLNRPEIQKALYNHKGTNIRKSESVQIEYLYYAKYYDTYFVRVALPYTIVVKDFMKPDNAFIYIITALFVVLIFFLRYILSRYAVSIRQLHDFVMIVNKGNPVPENVVFPNDELGDVAVSVVDTYKKLDEGKNQIAMEREKMLQHFYYSEEGLCIFAKDKTKIYANAHFLQYLNLIADKPMLNPERLFAEKAFEQVASFLENHEDKSLLELKITSNGRTFAVRVFIFEDKSFEIIINDVTKTEKTRLLKQEMTNNIAHELRTPVTTIRGFLETLINEKDNMPDDKKMIFMERAYSQAIRLSELIQDIGLITKTEEAPERFELEAVQLKSLLEELETDMENLLNEQGISMSLDVPDEVILQGNRTLLYSIFRNLLENSLRYGGDNIDIRISTYNEDNEFYYFSYYDTGKGVDEVHLNRIFERFYRVNEGRTRDTGGSGLGLSIVKNAIIFHKGEITAKQRAEGGLEFLFTLRKSIG